MTDKQPEALRLADDLDGACNGPLDFKHKAAAELRRLHEVNTELVEALKDLFWYVNQLEIIVYSADDIGEHEIVVKAKAAIEANLKEKNNG